MALYTINSDTLTGIADAIRTKRDITTQIKPEDMALAISLIDSGGASGADTGEVSFTGAGTYTSSFRIDHKLGREPVFIAWYVLYDGSAPALDTGYALISGMADVKNQKSISYYRTTSGGVGTYTSASDVKNAASYVGSSFFMIQGGGSLYRFPKGYKVRWFAV